MEICVPFTRFASFAPVRGLSPLTAMFIRDGLFFGETLTDFSEQKFPFEMPGMIL